MNAAAFPRKFKFQSTDSVITTLVSLSSETTIRCELEFAYELDIARCRAAIKALLEFEPVLKCRLVLNDAPYFQELNIADDELLMVTTVHAEYEKFKGEKINIENGPLFAFGVFLQGGRSTLLLKLAHEAADGFGLGEAINFVALHYRDPDAAMARIKPVHALSRSPERLTRKFGILEYPRLMWLNIKEKMTYFFPAGTMAYHAGAEGLITPIFHTMHFSSAEVSAMKRFAKARKASLNDLMLATFLRAMASSVGFESDKALRILLTINLRRYLEGSEIPSSEICNLSSMECVNIKKNLGKTIEETLAKVAAVTRKKKASGIGLNFVTDLMLNDKIPFSLQKKINASTRDMVMKTENYAVTITNVGEIDPGKIAFDSPPENISMFAPLTYSPFWCFSVYEYAGNLNVSCAVDSRRGELLQALYARVRDELIKGCNL